MIGDRAIGNHARDGETRDEIGVVPLQGFRPHTAPKPSVATNANSPLSGMSLKNSVTLRLSASCRSLETIGAVGGR